MALGSAGAPRGDEESNMAAPAPPPPPSNREEKPLHRTQSRRRPDTSQIPISKRRKSHAISDWIDRMTAFDLAAMFDEKVGPRLPRTVMVGEALPDEAYITTKRGKKKLAPGWEYPSNQTRTAKYTLITFIPRNLLEQFRRIANIFFLVLVILQFIPRFEQVSPALAALPLLVVLGITAIKDAYEDIKRRQADVATNNQKVLALRNKRRGFFGGGKEDQNGAAAQAGGEEDEEGGWLNPNQCRPKERVFSIPGRKWLGLETDKGKKEAQLLRRREALRRETTGLSGLVPDGGGEETHQAEAEARKKKHWWSRKRHVGGPKKAAPGGGAIGSGDAPLMSPMSLRDVEDPDLLAADETGDPDSTKKVAFLPTAWEDLRVGDFVKLRCDDSVPADMVICATSDEEDVCYIETKNLDGETNLKSRHAVPELALGTTQVGRGGINGPQGQDSGKARKGLRTAMRCSKAQFRIESEAPDPNMFKYSAAVVIPSGGLSAVHGQHHHQQQAVEMGQDTRCPVDLNTVLLRGTVVRNTEWVIGVIVFTGKDTKIVMNSSGTPSKRSKVERQMNPMVFINLGLLAAMCVFNAIGTHFEEQYYYDRNSYWTVFEDLSTDNPSINGAVGFANAMITYQNIVPISLYISIEFVRLVQAGFIWADDEIYYKPTKRRTLARSWNLSDDLGQIQYIFSDKTGTLTQNSMQFRQCSVGGRIYKGDAPVGDGGVAEDAPSTSDDATRVGTQPSVDKSRDPEKAGGPDFSTPDGSVDGADRKVGNAAEVTEPFKDTVLTRDLDERDSIQARNIHGFFATLGLCHTVLAAEDSDGVIQYKAQSPDEAALVQAAADVGFVFRGRDKNILRLQVPHDPDVNEWELLEVIEFSSARKRMSVIVRKLEQGHSVGGEGVGGGHTGDLFLLCKGADNVIFDRLAAGQDDIKSDTDLHLEEFANDGLRTLCLAYRRLDEGEYEDWAKRYATATAQVDDREEAMNKVQDEIEVELELLGATAIEDKLQDGVPEAIADLKRAGIKVWVATGDKLETAIAIAKSCNLISRDMNLIVVKGGAYDEPNSTYAQLRKALVEFFDASELVRNVTNLPPDAEIQEKYQDPRDPRKTLHRGTTGVSGVSDLVGDDNGQRGGGYALVIEGGSLQHAFAEPWSKELLLELSSRCQGVVCCRTSPMQKAEIVRLVRDGIGAQCLAIGDGANDVSMIQAADVGVGVAGEEGLQAVNSSDYAIGQFRFLVRLLTVHGHWSYIRNSNMIVNFFYKEIIGIAVLFFFQFFCAYSTTTVYEYTYLLLYNIIFTLLPPLVIGIFDQDIRQRVLMQVPELYAHGRDGNLFGIYRFLIYMLDGIYQGAVCFFLIYFTYNTTSARHDGYQPDIYEMSTVMITGVIFAANMYQGLNTRMWNWFVFWGMIIGPICVLLWTAVYSAIKPGWIWTFVYGNNYRLWRAAYWYLGVALITVTSLIPRYFIKYYKEMYYPNDAEILRIMDKVDPNHDWRSDPAMPYLREHARYEPDSSYPPRPSSVGPASPAIAGLSRTRTSMSVTHDMATGEQRGPSRGFGFDQADGMGEVSVAGPLRRYTSNLSNPSQTTRPRSRSIRIAGLEVGFPSLGGHRSNRRSRGNSIFGRPRSNTKGSTKGGNAAPTSQQTPRNSRLLSPPSTGGTTRTQHESPLREEVTPREDEEDERPYQPPNA